MNNNLMNGTIVTIGGANVREATCRCCDKSKAKGLMTKLIFPNNRFMVCDECITKGKSARPFNLTGTNEKSENCTSHRVVVSMDLMNADRFYLESYGFRKMNGYHTMTYHNAQSAGPIVASLIRSGYVVKVGLENGTLQVVHSVDEYDAFTKTVCMRNFE